MGTRYECNVEIFGPDEEGEEPFKMLNGIATWQEAGGHAMTICDADPRRAEIIVSEVTVANSKFFILPAVKVEADGGGEEESPSDRSTASRSIAVRVWSFRFGSYRHPVHLRGGVFSNEISHSQRLDDVPTAREVH